MTKERSKEAHEFVNSLFDQLFPATATVEETVNELEQLDSWEMSQDDESLKDQLETKRPRIL